MPFQINIFKKPRSTTPGLYTNQIPLTIKPYPAAKIVINSIDLYFTVIHSKVIVFKVELIQFVCLMAGKKITKKPLSLEDKQIVYKKIGKRLKELRKNAGYSAALDFAYQNEIPFSQYARYEAGSNMKIDSLLKVLHALDITLQDFFAGIE